MDLTTNPEHQQMSGTQVVDTDYVLDNEHTAEQHRCPAAAWTR